MSKELFYDKRMESYERFFDCAWAKTFFELVDGTKLKQPAFDLCLSWRGASNTYVLPWLLATMVQNTLQEKIQQKDPHAKKYITLVKNKILSEMRILFQRDQRKDLQRVLEKLYKKSLAVSIAVKQIPVFQPNETWQAFLKNSEFQFALLGSQRMCFGAVYYAYEDYLRQCVGLARGEANYRMSRKFAEHLTSSFSKSICDLCWSNPKVNIARITRNVLVHNGCRETQELRNAKHPFQVLNGEIQIMAEHTRLLFHALKERVTALTTDAINNPVFS